MARRRKALIQDAMLALAIALTLFTVWKMVALLGNAVGAVATKTLSFGISLSPCDRAPLADHLSFCGIVPKKTGNGADLTNFTTYFSCCP
jgi:hypothetical protein